jgi:hypothetical protein
MQQSGLIEGKFDANRANQYVIINGKLSIGSTPITSYMMNVNGSVYVQTGGIKVGNSTGMITENWWEFVPIPIMVRQLIFIATLHQRITVQGYTVYPEIMQNFS